MLRRACPRVVLLTDGQLVSQSTFRRIQLEQATAAAFRRSGSLQSEPSPSHQSTAGAQRPREQGSQASGQARAELGKVESQEYTRLLRMLGCRNGATSEFASVAFARTRTDFHMKSFKISVANDLGTNVCPMCIR